MILKNNCEKKERIDKIIASQGIASRSEVKALVKNGQVTINGVVVTDSSVKATYTDMITVSGKSIFQSRFIYIMLNKPEGVVSATDDKRYPTVVDIIPDKYKRRNLFPAGRLDKDTTGFCLITDDGDFAHKILSPKNHIFKTYLATLEHSLSQSDIEMLEKGITLADGTTLKEAKVEILEDGEHPLVQIMICEGKYHQVKRMFAATGNKVLSLHREKMGELYLDNDLKPGECRGITPDELEKITSK